MSTATITEDWAPVDETYADNSPARAEHRKAVLLAVIACAIDNGGEVHASTLRPLLPEGVNEHLIGNVMSQLSKSRILMETGEMRPSADARNRNSRRRLPVRRVADWDALRAEASR